MAIKKVLIPEIGEVVLAKRRGVTHLRLSVTAKGVIRVGMPYWTPYAAGIKFARERADWISKHIARHQISDFKDGDKIGKNHTLRIRLDESLAKPTSRLSNIEITIVSPQLAGHELTQKKIVEACNRALKQESEKLLPQRLEYLAKKNGFSYHSVRIRSLTSRWGSCSASKDITLSYFLIQLPWNLIDYVLLHELTHTRHMNHGPDFWHAMDTLLPGARKLRREVNKNPPRAMAANFGNIS